MLNLGAGLTLHIRISVAVFFCCEVFSAFQLWFSIVFGNIELKYLVMGCERKFALRKRAYSNILKISQPKNEKFHIKKSDIFHISAQNRDCGYSLEPPLTNTHDQK